MKIIDIYTKNSAKILDEILSLGGKNFSSKKLCVIFMNYDKSSSILKKIDENGIFTTSFEGFVRKILSKTSKTFTSQNISGFVATEVISSISKQFLSAHRILKNLTKSSSFPRELYNLFGMFKINEISSAELISACESVNISDDEKTRFKIIVQIYEKYTETLENNKFSDIRDVVLNCISELENNDLLKKSLAKNYDKIYVFGAENLSQIQLKLLKNIVNEDDLTLIGDKNAKIHTFMGANAFVFENSNEDTESLENTLFPVNKDIFARAIFMINPLEGRYDFKKSKAIEYRLFSDFQDELDFISRKIIEGVKNGDNYSDYAILLRDNSMMKGIVDILQKYEIPVNGRLYSEDFENFKIKFERILMICDILQKIGAKNLATLEKLSPKSLVELEYYAEQLNLLTENFLSDILENKFVAEKLLSLQTRQRQRFLFSTIFDGLGFLAENDAQILKVELKKIENLYEFYKNGQIVKIVMNTTNVADLDDENFHKFFAKFLSDLTEFSTLKKDVLKEKIEIKSILNLLQKDLSENLDTENKVNLLSIFKSSSKTFKHVCLPALSEGYFPKKAKSTYFISNDANEKISAQIRQKFPHFEKLILSVKDEWKDENSLLYVALTRAEEDILLSCHKFSDKKQVAPSSYFEELSFIDGKNLVSNELEKIDTQIAKDEVIDTVSDDKVEKSPVLSSDDKIWLSASSMTCFLKCPRKFYYTKLLGLKTQSSFSANYGTAVHAVFELIVSKYIEQFSKEKFLYLGEILFNVKNDRQALIDEGFDENNVVEELEKLSDLDIEEMRSDFLSAMDNLEEIGYFNEKPLEGLCEKHFEFELEEIPNVKFNGYIDAIIRYADGWRLVDYKTSKDKPKLSYLFSENGVNFCSETRATYNEANIKKYDYQIPLYYLACLNSPDLADFKENLSEVGYLYVRPKNSAKGDSWADFMPVSEIDNYKEKIVENIKTTVVDKIYSMNDFLPTPDEFACQYCDFSEYCNGKSKESEE